jgi:hypothetical protein
MEHIIAKLHRREDEPAGETSFSILDPDGFHVQLERTLQ